MKIVKFKNHKEWLEWRMNGIGGSEAAAVMDVCKFSNPKKLFALKTEQLIPAPSTSYMRRGKALEPLALDEYKNLTGIKMEPCFGESEDFPWALVSIDGINFEEKRVVEIKCPVGRDHSLALRGIIPSHYVWQLVHILMVTGFPSIDYMSFDGKNGVIIPFKRDLVLENRLIEEERKFWGFVLKCEFPEEKELSFPEKYKNVIEFRGRK